MKLNRKFLFICIIITILILSWSLADRDDNSRDGDDMLGYKGHGQGTPQYNAQGVPRSGDMPPQDNVWRDALGGGQGSGKQGNTMASSQRGATILNEVFGRTKPENETREEEVKEETVEKIKETPVRTGEIGIEGVSQAPKKAEEKVIEIEEEGGEKVVEILKKVTVEEVKKEIKKAEEGIKIVEETIEKAEKKSEEHKKVREEIEAKLTAAPEDEKIGLQKEVEETKALELQVNEESKKAEEKKLELSLKKSREELKEKIKTREELKEKIESEALSQEEKSDLEEQIKKAQEEEGKIKEQIDDNKESLVKKQEEVKGVREESIKQDIRKKVVAHVDEAASGEIKAPIIRPHEEVVEKIRNSQPVVIEVPKEKSMESINNIYEKVLKKEIVDSIIENIRPEEITSEELNEETEKSKEETDKEIEKIEEEIEVLQRKVEETAEAVEIKKTANFYEEIDETTNETKGNTVVTLTITPKQALEDFTVYEEIPKEIAEDITQITIYTEGYTVIESDPLIMWHFAQVNVPIDISYEINKKVEIETMKGTVTLPVADKIVGRVISEEPEIPSEETAKKPSLLSIILPLLVIPLIGIVLIYFNRFIGEECVPTSLDTTATSVQNQLHMGLKKEVIKRDLIKKGLPNSKIISAFLIAEENQKKKIDHHVGKLVYQIRMLSKRGHPIEEIRNTLIYKKKYPPLLVGEAIKKFKSINRKFGA